MKKFMTVALATAMTAALACTAFADNGVTTYPEGIHHEDQYGTFINAAELVDDVSKIDTVEFTFNVADPNGEYNGCISYGAKSNNWWTQFNITTENITFNDDDTWFASASGIVLQADDGVGDDGGVGTVKICLNDWGAQATLDVVKFVMKDKDGNVIYDSTAPATGDATPIIYLAAIVGMAGLAMVASKKRA